jgi:DNA-binding NarL/FixJ family response regulator
MIRVLLVENRPAIRLGLRMRLKLEADVSIIGEPSDGLAALAQTAVLRPDVILLDIESTDMDAIRLIRAMQTASPASAIVILSLHDDSATRRRASHAGAAAFVSKHEGGDGLVHAIRKAAGGAPQPTRALSAGGPASGLTTGREGV